MSNKLSFLLTPLYLLLNRITNNLVKILISMTEQEQLAEIQALIIGLNERVDHLEEKNDQISQQIREFDIPIDAF